MAGTQNGASEQGVFLRFPGQWDDPVWREAMMGAEGYQNVWRWYTPGTGRYTRTDPLSLDRSQRIEPNPYIYAGASPLRMTDRGLLAFMCFDFADREKTLSVTTPAGTTDVVTGTTYLPSGPLSTLTFGTGAWEDRSFTSRYLPASIVLTASRGRTWDYTTDAVGNPTQIVEAAVCPGDLVLQDELWVNRFDPFGEDPFAGTSSGASEQEIFLRFAGQWDDPVWREAMMGAEGYQNVHRWYGVSEGRYFRVDPLSTSNVEQALYLQKLADALYAYVNANPLTLIDPLGLAVRVCQRPNDIPQFDEVPVLDDLPHKWIVTDDKNIGLGQAGGEIPGDRLPECGCVGTELVDHTPEMSKPDVTCRTVALVDEECVNNRLNLGESRGNWMPVLNDCSTFVETVIAECRKNPARPGYRQSPL